MSYEGNNPVSQRREERESMFMKARIRLSESGQEAETRVRNLSPHGMMAEAEMQPCRGEAIEIELRHIGWITGRVAWVAGERFGIAFDVAINPKMMRRPVGQSKQELPTYLRPLGKGRPPLRGS